MSYIEDKFILQISSSLEKISKRDKIYNFICPYCGDSQKYKNKTRGYLYPIKDTYNYKCHNCGKSCSFSNFLKDLSSSYYDEYVFEKFKGSGKKELELIPTKLQEVASKKVLLDLPTIADLDSTHFARYFIEKRQIPEEKFEELYFCEKFKEWTNSKKLTYKTIKYDESRIIIPLVFEGLVFGYQGRTLAKSAQNKYITIIFNESIPKVYGLDDVDWSKNVYVVEGPIDSMFIPNSIAMVGADINVNELPNSMQTDFIFVYDNERRNPHIVKRMEKTINQGHSIVIWPLDLKYKDINDMILADLDPVSIIKNNTFRGLEAKAKMLGWKRI
jgi:predicted RNA-binding Zn-ribbon protein involved in translation (DUF1610 family)